MRSMLPTLTLTLLVVACGGGGGASSTATAPPVAPQINAPTSVPEQTTGLTATVTPQSETTYTWTIQGGELSGPATAPTITFAVGTTDPVVLACTATNKAGSVSAESTIRVHRRVPDSPVITGPTQLTAGAGGYAASVPSQYGVNYAWTITNGTLQSGQGTRSITFAAGSTGTLTLQCTVSNSAGSASGSLSLPVASGVVRPSTPVVTAASPVVTGTSGHTASIPAQGGCTYAWSITNGSIQSGQGTTAITYTPTAAGTCVLTATVTNSAGSAQGSASVTVNAPVSVSVSVSPLNPVLNVSGTQVITATVSGSTNTAVTWTVDDLAGGNGTTGLLTGTGASVTYTAPTLAGSHVVKATSVADPTKSASTTLSVQSGCATAPTSTTVLNVKDAPYSAKGDGTTDDTAAIQRAIDAVGGTGGTVLVPAGTYRINPVAVSSGGSHGLSLRSYMTLKLASGAVLKSLPTSAGTYALVMASGITQANVVGGTLEGDRAIHTGTSGEWGMGLSIVGSTYITAEGVTAKECWGDGFYVSGASAHITLCNVVADHNRRQGLSVTRVDTMVVRNSTFKNTTGALPEAGIDIEPNSGETVANLTVRDCLLQNNAGGGLMAGPPVAFAGLSFLVNVVVDHNTVTGSGVNPVDGNIKDGIQISNCDGVKVTNNTISGSNGRGMLLRNNASRTTVTGNTITGTLTIPGNTFWSGGGIYLTSCPNTTVSSNTVYNNSGYGIQKTTTDTTVVVTGNTVYGNGMTP
jgi:parallel beta-helix repeat protein